MAEGIEDVLIGKNTVCNDQILDSAFNRHIHSLLYNDFGHDACRKNILWRDVLVRDALLVGIEQHLFEGFTVWFNAEGKHVPVELVAHAPCIG